MARPSVPEQADVVVIGAGMGGLTAAALLSKAGLDVCVLEMDARPGGYLAGFRRKQFIFDSAIHWLNQCGPKGGVRKVLDFVGPGAPETPNLHRIRRYRGDSFDYLLTGEPNDLRDTLIADHPEQEPGLRKFFTAAGKIGRAFDDMSLNSRAIETMSTLDKARYGMRMSKTGLTFARYVGTTTEAAFAKQFDAPILQRIFCSEERLLSCLVPVGWAYSHDYQIPPAGGSQAFPRFLTAATRSFGSRVIYKARVDKIVLDSTNKKVAGVEVVVGVRDPQRHAIKCKYVLAACDLEAVYERMLPAGVIDPELLEKLKDADLYDSAVTISLGLSATAQELGFDEELVMLTRDDVTRKDHNAGDPEKTALNILAPSLRDPTMAPAGKGTLTILATANIAYADNWKSGPNYERGPAYQQYKQQYADICIDRVAAALSPRLRESIEVCDVATPITHYRYTGNRGGSLMGARPTRDNMRRKIAHYMTPVENLLLSGHWAEYGGGVPIAVRAGSNSALLVLQRERPAAYAVLRDILDSKRSPTDIDPDCFQSLIA